MMAVALALILVAVGAAIWVMTHDNPSSRGVRRHGKLPP